jgi:hypothetical protein
MTQIIQPTVTVEDLGGGTCSFTASEDLKASGQSSHPVRERSGMR